MQVLERSKTFVYSKVSCKLILTIMKLLLTLIIILTFFSSCQSFLGQFYEVHEPMTPLNITYGQNIKKTDFEHFIDTCDCVNKTTCSYTSIEIKKDERIVCLSDSTCECYLLAVSGNKIVMQAVFVPAINTSAWLTKQEQLNDSVIDRIRNNFTDKILTKFNQQTTH
jgi:hypothetical protein